MRKRLLSATIALCLSLLLFPTSVLATDKENSTLPDVAGFTSNEDFKPYDKAYPQKDRYGNYILKVPSLKNRLTFSTGEKNQVVGTLFAPGTSPTSGIQDATKKWHNDSGLCFAAASSNLIAWYLNQYITQHPEDEHNFKNVDFDVDKIFDKFRNGWNTMEGGDPKEALSWYFTGGFPSGEKPNNNELNGKEKGGYLQGILPHNNSDSWRNVSLNWEPKEKFTVYGGYGDNLFPYLEELEGNIGTEPLSTYQSFSEEILRQLHYGPCAISIGKKGATGTANAHAVTLWGADYDVDTGMITKVYITDSDDYDKGMFEVKITKNPTEEQDPRGIVMENYPIPMQGEKEPYITIKSSLLLYAPDVVTPFQPYNGKSAVIQKLDSNSNGTEVTVQAKTITNEILEYGYSYDKNPENVENWQVNNHFSSLKPDQYYFFARVRETENHNAGGVSNPSPHRVHTPSPTPTKQTDSIFLGTTGFQPYDSETQSYQYIWFGEDKQEDNAKGEPILWRVLDNKTNKQEETGLYLLADRLYGSGKNGNLRFSTQQFENHYQGSNAQNWCKEFEKKALKDYELNAILPTTKSDSRYKSPEVPMAPNGVWFAYSPNILSGDQMFLPSVEEMLNPAYGFATDKSRLATYRGGNYGYWLRSPKQEGTVCAGHVDDNGYVFNNNAVYERAARPAFNLSSDHVLYTAAVKNNTFKDSLGLEKIQQIQSNDFRLILKDSDRKFHVTTETVNGYPGKSVSVSYQNARTGDNEYLSVILQDSDKKSVYYGKIGLVSTENGSVDILLPQDLATGSYTMLMFNEQYNGEKESGLGSDFNKINLQVDTSDHVEDENADYSAVEDAIALLPTKDRILYKDLTEFDTAVANIKYDMKKEQQKEVDEMAQAIQKAFEKLEYKDADYTKVKEAIAMADELKKDDYLDFSAVEEAINAVQYDKNITEQEIVNGYALAIKNAINALEIKPTDTEQPVDTADYSAVKNAIALLPTKDRILYKDLTEFDTAVANVKYGMKKEQQEEVNAMAQAIQKAFEKLEYKDADYTKVKEAIAMADELKKDDYLDFSAVEEAINAVQYDKNITEQEIVNGYALAIENAINALEVKPVEPKPTPKPPEPIEPPKPAKPDETDKPNEQPVPPTETVSKEYQFLEGDESNFHKDAEGTLTFRIDGDFSKFQNIEIDGVLIDKDNYTAWSGSTYIRLNADYLKELSTGNHQLTVVYTDGKASTTFQVTEDSETVQKSKNTTNIENTKPLSKPKKTNTPKTGDNNHIARWVLIGFVSLGVILVIFIIHKKKKR